VPLVRVNGFRAELVDNPGRLHRPFVYALTDGEAVKVGKSRTHPRTRMEALQTGSSRELVLLAYDARLSEREAHRKLHRHRRRGEWFDLCPEVLAEIGRWDWCDTRAVAALRHGLGGGRG
jgi:hypothetical protein